MLQKMPQNSNESAENEKSKRIFHLWPVKVLILLFCLWLVFILAGKVLCKIAIAQIAELTNTKITTESVNFSINGSVLIKGLVIRPEQRKEYEDTILKAKTVYARFGIGSLLLLHPRLKRISVKDFLFDAQHDLDTDRWNIAAFRIKPPKGAAGEIPVIRLKRGTLQYSKVSNGRVKAVAAVPIDAGFVPARKTQDGCRFNITTADRVDRGKSVLTGFWRPGRITITGGISSADIPAFEKAWTINAFDAQLNYDRSGAYSLEFKVEDLHSRHTFAGPAAECSSAFAADKRVFLGKPGPFTALQRFFNSYRPSGTAAIDLQAHGNLERLSESELVGKVYCKDISICYRGFPYAIERMTGRIDLTEKGVALNNLCGWHDNTEVAFNGWSKDFGPDWKYQIRITSDNMALDNDLYDALSAKQKKFWSAFSPAGLAAIDYRLSRQSRTDKKGTLTAELLGGEAAYRQFPYPLKNLSGKLLFADDSVIVSDVISQVNDCKITLNGKVTACSAEQPVYDISIEAKDVPLDSTLFSSLSEEKSSFYNRLDMDGMADADIKIFTPELVEAGQDFGPTNFIADVSLKKASLSCGFLVGKAGGFPLVISGISAKTIITSDLIQIEDFTGRYNQTSVSLAGRIRPGDEASKLSYSLLLHAEQMELNDELISLMPQQLRKIISELQPQGKVDLTADLNKADSNSSPDYKVTVDCSGNSINFEPVNNITGRLTITKNVITLEDIAATAVLTSDNTLMTPDISTVKINGRITLADDAFSNRLKISAGNISFAVDSLKVKGKSLTGLKLDTSYDPGRKSWIAEDLVADCYGGKLAGKFELKRSEEADLEYLFQAGFENVDLKQFLLDTNFEEKASGSDHTSGKMSGLLSVAGRTGESLPYIGRCRLLITDMHVGTLSPLAKLLYVLKLTEPEDFAFRQMVVDSYIKHNSLFFEQFDLSGKAVAFNGSGLIDLQSYDADLILFARGRRLATAEPSILQSLTEGLGRAVVRMEVTGNVYDPSVTTTPLPVLEEAVNVFVAPRRR
ncbi:MAG: hypothetical protein PHQ35_03235 [Phycisphaerae bacterium]|nr:hypothetical protein [Phycisphaerae bacterium]MDD5380693.1 hypothetical protein [Phycisphaerae bacterium]